MTVLEAVLRRDRFVLIAALVAVIVVSWIWIVLGAGAGMSAVAAPVLLLFARVNRTQQVRDRPYVPTGFFGAGYLTVWSGFSAVATGLQWGFEQLGLLGSMMTAKNYWFGGVTWLRPACGN